MVSQSPQSPFHISGCLIIELQDYRGKPPNSDPTVRKVLLKPDIEAVIHDVEQMCSKSGREWSQDEKMAIEQKILVYLQGGVGNLYV
jgi:hypothetical protein